MNNPPALPPRRALPRRAARRNLTAMQDPQRWPVLALATMLTGLLTACSPWLDSPREEDHPLLNEAVARKASSPREAERLLEKALDANPRLARAHWELALLHLNYTSNYAAAVYHFQRVLALRPDWPQANTTTQLIARAKLELIKEGFDLPVLPSVQRQLDRYVAEIHRLNTSLTNLQTQVRALTVVTQQLAAQNLQLRQQLQALSAAPAPTAAPPNPVPVPAPSPVAAAPGQSREESAPPAGPTRSDGKARATSAAAASPSTAAPVRPSAAAKAPTGTAAARPTDTKPPVAGGRTHTFKPGETARSVAERYHLTLRDLMRANPGVNLNQVRAGQTIRLP